MKKIVIILSSLQGGGAEKVALTLYQGFVSCHDVECHVVCLENVIDHRLPENIHLHILDLPKRNFFTAAFYKQWQARRIDNYILENIGMPDLVLSNLTNVDKLMKFSRLPVWHIIHNTTSVEYLSGKSGWKAAGIRRKLESIYKNHPVTCVSKGVMDDLKKNFSIQQPVRYIYNPVDVEAITKLSCDVADQDLIDSYGDYIIHVGTFKEQKNHELLIKAYALSGVEEKLVLLGRTKGAVFDRIMKLIEKLGLQDKVIYCDFKSNPYPFMRRAKLFVLSSFYEGFPCVLLEAVALGVPVVSTDCPSGPNELFGEEYRHCLSPVNDAEALAANIRKALANPKHYTVPLRDEFRLESVVAQYMALIEDVGKDR